MTMQELIEGAYKSLSNSGEYERIFRDVPFEDGSIDMVLVDKHQKLNTIVFDLENWKKALRKARGHALGADRSYICLPAQTTPAELKVTAAQQGIGVLTFQPKTGKVSALTRPLAEPPFRRSREELLRGIAF